jgi:hypothetical protein
MVSLRSKKNLSFMHEPPKGFRVDDPVPVPLEIRSENTFIFFQGAAFRFRGFGGTGGKNGVFPKFEFFSKYHFATPLFLILTQP